MELYKRPKSPYWYVDRIDPETGVRQRRSTGKTNRLEAQKAAGQMEVDAERRADEARNGKRAITLRETLDRYVAHVESEAKPCASFYALIRDKTLALRAPFIGRFSLDGSRHLHTLEPSDLADLVTARRREGNGAQTIAHELKLLRAATRYAGGLRFRMPDDLVNGTSRNPWRMPKLTSKTRYLSRAEFQRVFDAMSPDRPMTSRTKSGAEGKRYAAAGARRADFQNAQDLLVALALTGGRWQEVAQLSWSQVDFEGGLVRLWAGKTQSERVVPLPDPARRVLERRRDDPHAHPTLIFPGRNGEPRSKNSCGPILRAMDGAGLNDPASVAKHGMATVHSLRHSFASWLLQGGADLSEVQGALGHATLQMTTRYAHLSQTKTVAKLNRLLGESFDDGRAATA